MAATRKPGSPTSSVRSVNSLAVETFSPSRSPTVRRLVTNYVVVVTDLCSAKTRSVVDSVLPPSSVATRLRAVVEVRKRASYAPQ